MCIGWHFFHDWSHWSKPEPVSMTKIVEWTFEKFDFIVHVQERTCRRCSEVERRRVEH